ncbi:MAG: NRDE family protein [Fidelibacterota bacterium]
MCTLTVRFDPEDNVPVIVAANRDELYSRLSAPPSVIQTNPSILAPQDMEAGGTWLGVNEHGLLASVTNVWIEDGEGRTQGEVPTRSRGLLTLDALKCKDVAGARTVVQRALRRDVYQFFNLLVATEEGGIIFAYAGKLTEYPLTRTGATILNSPYYPEKHDVRRLPGLESGGDHPGRISAAWLREIKVYLSQHPDICKHGEIYGTRSSHIVLLSRRDRKTLKPLFGDRFWYAWGAPCETDFVDFSVQLQTMGTHEQVRDKEE